MDSRTDEERRDLEVSEPTLVYQCMSCGIPDAAVPLEEALHSGCVLVCPECGGETVLDLWNPAQRAAFCGRIERAERERDAARKWAAAWKLAARAMRKARRAEAQPGRQRVTPR